MENFETTGFCSLCNKPIKLRVGTIVNTNRWRLIESMECYHCKAILTTALRDDYGRFWGRKRIFND